MAHPDLVILFSQFGVMILVAVIGGQVMRRLKQPAVLGELLAGILIGPTVFGTVAPRYFQWLFPADRALDLSRESVISVGMLFFLFVAGLEVNLTNIRGQKKEIASASFWGWLIPMVSGMASVWLFPGVWGDQALQHQSAFGIFVGTALSISALPVIARILMDLKLIQTRVGMVVMTAASMNDIIGWTLFAIILNGFPAGNDGGGLGGRQLWANLI